jgi:hypothetical protein
MDLQTPQNIQDETRHFIGTVTGYCYEVVSYNASYATANVYWSMCPSSEI